MKLLIDEISCSTALRNATTFYTGLARVGQRLDLEKSSCLQRIIQILDQMFMHHSNITVKISAIDSTALGTQANMKPLICGQQREKRFRLDSFHASLATIQTLPQLSPTPVSITCRFTQNLYLHVGGGGGTSDNLDQLASNDGLTSSVVENLVLANHLSSVLGGILQSACQHSTALIKISTSEVRLDLRPWHFGGQTARRRDPQPDPSR